MTVCRIALVAAVSLSPLLLLPGCRRPHTSAPQPSSVQASAPVSEPPARLWLRGTADVPVIMYHDVVPRKEVWFDLTTREFEQQMEALSAADATVVPLSDVVEHLRDGKPLPPRAIALTFDDGTLGNFTYAFPILAKYGYPATFFVHTNYVGVKSTKDHMTWDQLRELKRSGLIDVQPHTASHPESLNDMGDEAVRAELSTSNAVLEREMGYKPRFLAYPSGHGDERVARLVEEAGYEAAFNEVRAWAASPADRFHLPRFAPFRLYEVLEKWRLEETDGPAPVVLQASDTGRYSLVGPDPVAEALDYQAGLWPEVRTAGGRGLLALAEVGPPGKQPSSLPELRGGDVLLGSDGFTPMPEGRQRAAIGRPIIVANKDRVMVARYQPWMGVEPAALEALLPGATLAVVGDDWFLHEGQLLGPEKRRRVRRAAVLGVLDDGRPFVGRTGRRATVESLTEELIRIGAREAILL